MTREEFIQQYVLARVGQREHVSINDIKAFVAGAKDAADIVGNFDEDTVTDNLSKRYQALQQINKTLKGANAELESIKRAINLEE